MSFRSTPDAAALFKLAPVAIAFFAILGSFYTVSAGERAVVTRFGSINGIESDGLHFKVPFIETVTKVDVRTLKAHSPANAGTNDLQRVSTEVAVNYHLDAAKLRDTFTRVGLDVESKVIDPRIQEVVKAVVARYTAESLLKQREAVRDEIVSMLTAKLAVYNIVLEDVQITNFAFSKVFDDAIEAKQTAEQNALKAKNDLDRIRVEAEQTITKAKADAEAVRVVSEAIQKQGGAAFVQLEAIKKWDGTLPQVNGGATPFINLNTTSK